MARPREFDTNQAVSGAMDVFWEHGYEGASLPDLLSGMGITRGSLYKAFGDKKTLFLTVMEYYEQQAVLPAVTLLKNERISDGRERIETLFASIVGDVRAGDQRGCLLCSAAAGPAAEDVEIAEAVRDLLGKMQKGFVVAIDHSKTGPARNETAKNELANLFVTQYVGLRTLARSKAPLVNLEHSVSSLLSALP